jgi:hypothetical protein
MSRRPGETIPTSKFRAMGIGRGIPQRHQGETFQLGQSVRWVTRNGDFFISDFIELEFCSLRLKFERV